MYDYNKQIKEYHRVKVTLPDPLQQKLRDHRETNQNRLINNIPDGIKINKSRFIKQGSYAMKTIIQDKDNNYDIDDGVWFDKDDLVDNEDKAYSSSKVKEIIQKALEDKKFNKKPKIMSNCVRVFYAEGHHVDIPAYRRFEDNNGNIVQELAGDQGWTISDPEQINRWFSNLIETKNKLKTGSGSQLRRMIRLLKRFCKSRASWDMPSGIKLTMLVAELYTHYDRDDEAFDALISSIVSRLELNLEIENLADNNLPRTKLTRTTEDANILELRDHLKDAIENLKQLHLSSSTKEEAKKAWEWVFRSGGFFEAYDKNSKEAVELFEKAVLVEAGLAFTSPQAKIGTQGVKNKPHSFYGEE